MPVRTLALLSILTAVVIANMAVATASAPPDSYRFDLTMDVRNSEPTGDSYFVLTVTNNVVDGYPGTDIRNVRIRIASAP